jgi:hypothetical protein
LQASQGEFVESGRQDILSSAIGTDEHCGRVRAVGRAHGLKSYFGPAKRRQSQSTPEVKDMIKTAVAEALAVVREQYETSLQAAIREMRDEISSMRTPAAQPVPSRQEEDMRVAVQPHGQSEKASSPDPFADLPAVSNHL